MKKILGWDIGGAHLKLCVVKEDKNILETLQFKTPMWEDPKIAHKIFKKIIKHFDIKTWDEHFFTMTGEISDCFLNRKDGVKKIISQIDRAFGNSARYYSQDKFLKLEETKKFYSSIASANWHATALFISKFIKEGFLIDIGTTTTDIIVIKDSKIMQDGFTDSQRLRDGSLVYLGVSRTSISSLKSKLIFKNKSYNVMREMFANTADVFRVTKQLNDVADLYPSCDKGPKTITASQQRLARVIGMDRSDGTNNDWILFSNYIISEMIKEIVKNFIKLEKKYKINSTAPIVFSGCGNFLSQIFCNSVKRKPILFHKLVPDFFIINNDDFYGIDVCAPAVSLAIIKKIK